MNSMNEYDCFGLPVQTRHYVTKLQALDFDRTKVHGLFVLLGLIAGAPRTSNELEELFGALGTTLPIDRREPIDEVVGHIYSGYERQINEFVFRLGEEISSALEFRKISIPNLDKQIAIVYPRNEGLLNPNVYSIGKLRDASLLYESFIHELGRDSASVGCSLLESYRCGIFQTQLLARYDVNGSRQLISIISECLPLILGRCVRAVTGGNVEYFIGLKLEQIALMQLAQAFSEDYGRQFWGFQSALFFRDGGEISGVSQLSGREWFDWVLGVAKQFDAAYPTQLLPFSAAGVELEQVPIWNDSIESFVACDEFIKSGWGYDCESHGSKSQTLEYNALMVHTIFASLTISRETKH